MCHNKITGSGVNNTVYSLNYIYKVKLRKSTNSLASVECALSLETSDLLYLLERNFVTSEV